MTLLKNILFIVLVSLSLTAFAQQKEAEALNELYLKGSYEKCLKKAVKYAADYPNQYQFPLYIAVSEWQFNKAAKQDSTVLNCLEQLDLAYRLNGKKVTRFTAEQKQIYKAALLLGPNLLKQNRKDEAKKLYGYVASVFKDTTEEYTWLYPTSGTKTTISSTGANTINNSKPNVTPEPSRYGTVIDKMLEYSRTFLGLPYRAAGCDPSTGFDCSGFVTFVFKQFDIILPRSSQELSKLGVQVPIENVKPGDLLFYGTRKGSSYHTSHVALVYSNENGRLAFIHSSSRGVVIDDPESASWEYWQQRFLFAKRII